MSRARAAKRCPRCGHPRKALRPWPSGDHHACGRCIARELQRRRIAEFVRAKVQPKLPDGTRVREAS